MEKQVLLFGACYYTGIMGLVRWWMRRSGPRLIILNYHRAAGGDLRRHLLYLRRHYRMMHLEEALQALSMPDRWNKPGDGEQEGQRGHDRRTPLVLTFDDGYRDNYTHGFPLARELCVPMTIFLIPGYIESGRCFWWLAGDCLLRAARVSEAQLEGRTYHLAQLEDRQALAQVIYTRAFHARSVAEREAFLEKIREMLDVPTEVPLSEHEQVLNWAEIREMEQSGWVSFGGHTMHHPVLAYLADTAELRREASDCRLMLEQQLGHPVRTFAYPMGKPAHIGPEAPSAVQEAGYAWAVTTTYGLNTPQDEPFRLYRVVGDVKLHWLLLAADTSGLRKFFSPLFPYARRFLSAGTKITALWSKSTIKHGARTT